MADASFQWSAYRILVQPSIKFVRVNSPIVGAPSSVWTVRRAGSSSLTPSS